MLFKSALSFIGKMNARAIETSGFRGALLSGQTGQRSKAKPKT
jgi:hypothetical protein